MALNPFLFSLIPKDILRGLIRAVKKNIKYQTLVHIEAMEISSGGIIQTECLEVPFLWFVGVVTPSNMAPFESDAHLFYVKILITNIESRVHLSKMVEEGGHTPETVVQLCRKKCSRFDHMQTFL